MYKILFCQNDIYIYISLGEEKIQSPKKRSKYNNFYFVPYLHNGVTLFTFSLKVELTYEKRCYRTALIKYFNAKQNSSFVISFNFYLTLTNQLTN
jgi:hypothetical protein